VGFASGVGVAIMAALVSSLLQKRRDFQRRREPAAFRVYMLLLELNAHYFWVVSREIHGEPSSPEITAKVNDLALRT